MTVDRCQRHGHKQVYAVICVINLCWACFAEVVADSAEQVPVVDSKVRTELVTIIPIAVCMPLRNYSPIMSSSLSNINTYTPNLR